MGFYKLDDHGRARGHYLKTEDESCCNLMHAPNKVVTPNDTLSLEDNDKDKYPVDGWYYFEIEEEAVSFFGIKENADNTEVNRFLDALSHGKLKVGEDRRIVVKESGR